jgi:hypothetical protein
MTIRKERRETGAPVRDVEVLAFIFPVRAFRAGSAGDPPRPKILSCREFIILLPCKDGHCWASSGP